METQTIQPTSIPVIFRNSHSKYLFLRNQMHAEILRFPPDLPGARWSFRFYVFPHRHHARIPRDVIKTPGYLDSDAYELPYVTVNKLWPMSKPFQPKAASFTTWSYMSLVMTSSMWNSSEHSLINPLHLVSDAAGIQNALQQKNRYQKSESKPMFQKPSGVAGGRSRNRWRDLSTWMHRDCAAPFASPRVTAS